jgi:fatty acid desaturase
MSEMTDESDRAVSSFWERTSRAFATAAVVFFAAAVLLAGRAHPGPLPVVSLIACLLSVGVVIKSRLAVHRANHAAEERPVDLPVE